MRYYVEKFFGSYPPPWLPLGKHKDPWDTGFTKEARKCPGAYEIALVHRGVENVELYEIIYVGESHGGNLGKRLDFFRSAACGGTGAHSAGKKFKKMGLPVAKCYFRVYPITDELVPKSGDAQSYKGALAKLIERELIWEFCVNNGQLPLLNDR